MCNNITTIATSFWFHLFSKPIHFGQFFWHLVLSLLSSHPRFGDGTGRTGTWTVEEGQACYQAPTIRTCCLPFLGFGGKTGLRWGDAKIYGIFFWAGWGGGIHVSVFFFGYESSFFFLVWVFFCLTLDEFRVVFFWKLLESCCHPWCWGANFDLRNLRPRPPQLDAPASLSLMMRGKTQRPPSPVMVSLMRAVKKERVGFGEG